MFDDIPGGNVQGVADLAGADTGTATDQADTPPAGAADGAATGQDGGGIEASDGAAGREGDAAGADAGGDTKPQLTAEERQRNAAIRRQREAAAQRAAQETERRANQARIDAAYAQAYHGQTNPYTGKPILTERDFKDYEAMHRDNAARQQLQKVGIDPAALSTIVEQSPVVQDLRSKLGQMQAGQEAARLAQGKQLLEGEVKAISAIDPAIRSLDDLFQSEAGPLVMAKVTENPKLSLIEAYKLINFDRISSQRAQAAKAGALNQAAGKGHLKPNGAGAAGDAVSLRDIPEETVKLYRQMNPGVSDSDIVKHYSKQQVTVTQDE